MLPPPRCIPACHLDGAALLIDASGVHGGGHGAWRGQEGLHLAWAPPLLLEPARQALHVAIGAAREAAEQIGHQVLLLAGPCRERLELPHEVLEGASIRLAHKLEHCSLGVLGRHLELAAGEARDQSAGEAGVLQAQVVSHAAGHAQVLHSGHGRRLFQQPQILSLGMVQVGAKLGGHAGVAGAGPLLFREGAARPPQVGCGAADVAHGSLEARVTGEHAHLLQDGGGGARAVEAPLVQSQ